MSHGKMRFALLAASLFILPGFAARANTLTPGDILLSDGNNHQIDEYTLTGKLVQTINAPYPGGNSGSDYNRDLTVDASGRIQLFNGTFNPYLSTYTPATNTWTQRTFAGWSTINNGSFGGVATFQNYAYVTDTFTYNGGEPSGIVRFNLANNTAQRYMDGTDYIDLTLGQDGLLYALSGSGSPSGTSLSVFDPATMKLIRMMDVPGAVQGGTDFAVRRIAVNAQGDIFYTGLYGPIFRVDKNGVLLNQVNQASYPITLYSDDLDLSQSGQLMITEYDGHVLLTDQSFSHFDTILQPGSFQRGFAAFVPFAAVPEPSVALLLSVGTVSALAWRWKRRRK